MDLDVIKNQCLEVLAKDPFDPFAHNIMALLRDVERVQGEVQHRIEYLETELGWEACEKCGEVADLTFVELHAAVMNPDSSRFGPAEGEWWCSKCIEGDHEG